MKTGLLFKDKPFRLRQLNNFDKDLIDDLELELIINAASEKSKILKNVFENGIASVHFHTLYFLLFGTPFSQVLILL